MKKDNKIVSLEQFKNEKEQEQKRKRQQRKEELESMELEDISYEDFKENVENILEQLNNDEMEYEVEQIIKENLVEDYLEEYNRVTLLYLCTTLRIAIEKNFDPEIDFTFKQSEEYIDMIIQMLEENVDKLLKMLTKSELELLKDIAKYGILGLTMQNNRKIENAIKVLSRTGLVFVQYKDINEEFEDDYEEETMQGMFEINSMQDMFDPNGLMMSNIHIPEDIRYTVMEKIDQCNSERNENILNLVGSCINVYGAIWINDLYDILKMFMRDLKQDELEDLIGFRALTQSELFAVNADNTMIYRLDFMGEENKANEIANIRKEKYTLGFYLKNIELEYVHSFEEYNEFVNQLEKMEILEKINNTDEYVLKQIESYDEMLQRYICTSQVNLAEAKGFVENGLDCLFCDNKKEIKKLIKILDKIAMKYPKWNKGGKI